MPSLKLPLTMLGACVTVIAATLHEQAAVLLPARACTTGTPTKTAGYPMPYYAPATPSANSFVNGYQPEPRWARQHLVGSYTFGVPEPVETGFAYAQFKCQYYCENQSSSGSFFVRAEEGVGSHCECYDELLDPDSFVDDKQTLVGAWNAICRA